MLLSVQTTVLVAQQNSDSLLIDHSLVEKFGRLIVTEKVSLFKTSAIVSIDSISTPAYQARFARETKRMVQFSGYDKFVYYWFRIIIRNTDSVPGDLMLLLAPVGMKEGRLYRHVNGRWDITGRNGFNVRFSERPYLYSHYVFPLRIAQNSVDTIYLSMDAQYSYKSYGFDLLTPKNLRLLENNVYFSFGVIIGLLSLFLLINFYLYFTWNDKIQLWYTLYIAMLILIVIKNDQFDQEFFGWDSERMYFMTSIMGIGAIAISVLMHVIQMFLANIKRDSWIYKLSHLAKWNLLASGVMQLITFYIHIDHQSQAIIFRWAQISSTSGIVIIIADCIYSIFKGNKSAYFFLVGLVVFFTGAIQRIETIDTSAYFYPPYIFHYGMVIETLTISFGLIYRYRLERKRSYRYQKEKEMLKSNMEKLILESRIEIQEQTLQTVIKEINNNVGQKINLIRDKLANLKSSAYADAEDHLSDAKRDITNSIADLRNLCKRLDADYVKEIGLLKSVEDEVEQCRKSGLCNTMITISGNPYRIDSQKELILFRICQEILNWLNEYKKGIPIHVTLKYNPELVEILLVYGQATIEKDSTATLDVFNLRNKAGLIGASFIISNTVLDNRIIMKVPVRNSTYHLQE